MFCNKCGYEFKGSFCPKCGAKSKTTVENNTVDNSENPYSTYYTQQNNNYGEYANSQQAPVPPQQVYPPYQPTYTEPPKSNMTTGKIIAIVLLGIFTYALLTTILPIGLLIGCATYADEIEYLDNANNSSVDLTYEVGDTIYYDSFSYTLKSIEEVEIYNGIKAKEGYKLVKATLEIVNVSDEPCYLDGVSLSMYNGDLLCKQLYSDEDSLYYEYILPSKVIINEHYFEVPVDATDLEIAMSTFYDDTYIFTIE